MNKKHITIFVLLSVVFSSYAMAQSDAVLAAAIFEEADVLQESYGDAVDAELVMALNELSEMVADGKRYLINQKIENASLLAERVKVQIELVKVLARLVLFKEKLEAVQRKTGALTHKKQMLEAKHRRLLLQDKGRALTGAFPAPPASNGESQ